MSDLRKQLQDARSEYESIRYPGDLAADVRRRNRDLWRVLLPLAPYGAVAAVIALMIYAWPGRPGVQSPTGPMAVAPTVETVEVMLPEAVAMPSEMPSVPAATFSLPESYSVPSVPSIPSWSVSTNVSLEESSQEEQT